MVISGLYATENNQTVMFDRPVKAVALDPYYYRSGGGRHYVTGDEKVQRSGDEFGGYGGVIQLESNSESNNIILVVLVYSHTTFEMLMNWY